MQIIKLHKPYKLHDVWLYNDSRVYIWDNYKVTGLVSSGAKGVICRNNYNLIYNTHLSLRVTKLNIRSIFTKWQKFFK